jgi:Predicted periplasmic solute-binding protein
VKWLARIAVALFAVLAGAGAIVAAFFWVVNAAPGPLAASRTLVIPKGATAPEIARQLDDAGVVENALLFRLADQVIGEETSLHAGEYAFPAGATVVQVLELLRSGHTVVRKGEEGSA